MLQSPFEARPKLVQFVRVFAGEAAQDLPTFLRKVQNRATPVSAVSSSGQQPLACGTIDQFDGAVVLQSKAFGSVGNRDCRTLGRTRNLEKELVLLRLQTCGRGCGFAEMYKPAQFVAKVGERA